MNTPKEPKIIRRLFLTGAATLAGWLALPAAFKRSVYAQEETPVMPFWTLLMVKVPATEVEVSTEAFVRRRIIEECAEVIPGFLHGELVKSHNGDGQICVMCKWTGKEAYDQWVASPVRDKQNGDAARFTLDAGFGADDVHTLMFDSVHVVTT